MQEVDGVTIEVDRTAPEQVTGDNWRLARSPGVENKT